MNTPLDIYNYIVQSGKESDFLSAILLQKQNYSIAEIPDAAFLSSGEIYRMQSKAYRLDQEIQDAKILEALGNHMYVTAFLSRHGEVYQLHFLAHPYPVAAKTIFEDDIAHEVVRYMILNTVIALRLTTWKKVDDYLR